MRSAIDAFPDYRGLLSEGYDDDKTIEDQFFELEVNLNRLAFEQQFHYGARPDMQRAPTRTCPRRHASALAHRAAGHSPLEHAML